jgi:hypothetical protein
MTRRIVLHIDRLVLNGVDRSEADDVTAGLEAELRRQLARDDAALTLGAAADRSRIETDSLHAGAERLGRDTGRAIGARIARSLTANKEGAQ